MKVRLVLAALLLLLFGGCGDILARAVVDAAYLHEAASDRVREQHERRKYIRQECYASVDRDILRMIEEKKEVEVRRLLREAYPPLITTAIIDRALEGRSDILTGPPGCNEP